MKMLMINPDGTNEMRQRRQDLTIMKRLFLFISWLCLDHMIIRMKTSVITVISDSAVNCHCTGSFDHILSQCH